ncbi:hypothetical protein [Neorhizobium sp. DAR64862/K0K3]|uniref:hypothetical protein n=1 Tax=Neorhizobium sp. DAR64862/K0K3 TaxID=3421957 RepID=UPI003D2D5E6D
MNDLIPFIPKADRSASKNMIDFISFSRNQLTVFGTQLEFDAVTWDVSERFQRRGHSGRILLNFTKLSPSNGFLGEPFPEPFASQCRAYIRYKAAANVNAGPPQNTIMAFRELLRAFEGKNMVADLCTIDAHILDNAVAMASSRKSGNYASTIGTLLRPLAKFLRDKKLAVHAPIDWKHGRPWKTQVRGIGAKSDERRGASLPSQEALDALPEAFLLAKEPGDIILSSVVALLACAPSRVNEIFALPEDCEIKPLVEGEEGYMLRWAGSKGYHDFAKAIPEVMTDLAQRAIERIRAATTEAREIALWYESNPNKLYLPPDCSHLRGQMLSYRDLAQIIGYTATDSAGDWVRSRKIVPVFGHDSKGRRLNLLRFKDVEREIVALLPRDFPIADRATGLKVSQSLTVVRRNEFGDEGKGRWRCMISLLGYNNVQNNFHHAYPNIFSRLGLSTRDDPITIRTHQLRHYLNTLAQRGGLSEVEIAAWSGRKDIRQNAVYDQRSPGEILASIRIREKQLPANGAGKISINAPVSRTQAASIIGHGHATDLGFCEHDFASSPCNMFMECLQCTKHVCVKGHDPRHLERVAMALEHARKSMKAAEAGMANEYEGAAEWYEAHTEIIRRLEQLHALLCDPEIPDGSVIRLSKSGRFSAVEQAMHDQGLTRDADLVLPHGLGESALPYGNS